MKKNLTKNEGKVLKFIYDHSRPTYREITDGVDLSDVTSAVYVVNSLIKKKLLKKTGHAARSIEITDTGYLRLHGAFIADLRKWLQSEKMKISFPEEFKISGVATPPKLSNNYWESMKANGTQVQGASDVIKTAVSYLLSFSETNGTSKDLLNKEKFKEIIPILFSVGMLPTFCWAIIFSIIILPACFFILKENWLTGFIVVSFFVILVNSLNIKK